MFQIKWDYFYSASLSAPFENCAFRIFRPASKSLLRAVLHRYHVEYAAFCSVLQEDGDKCFFFKVGEIDWFGPFQTIRLMLELIQEDKEEVENEEDNRKTRDEFEKNHVKVLSWPPLPITHPLLLDQKTQILTLSDLESSFRRSNFLRLMV